MKKTVGPFCIVGASDPSISSTKDVMISLHDDQENIITVAVKSDLLQVIAQQLIVAAQQAESGPGLGTQSGLPVVVEANKATFVREPGQGLFFIFEVKEGLSYIFPTGPQLATALRDQMTDALVAPWPERTMN